jgi:hypothetical protein
MHRVLFVYFPPYILSCSGVPSFQHYSVLPSSYPSTAHSQEFAIMGNFQSKKTESLYMTRDHSWAPTTTEVPVDTQGPECYGRVCVLKKRPSPALDDSCFAFEDQALPETLKEGTALVQATHLSMDPTHFIWTQEILQYMPAVGINTVMRGIALGKIVKTTDEANFPVGKLVSITGGIAEYTVVPRLLASTLLFPTYLLR